MNLQSRDNIRACARSRSATGPTLADELLDLVIKGVKTATCSTEDEPNTSTPGERWIVLDGRGEAAMRDRNAPK